MSHFLLFFKDTPPLVNSCNARGVEEGACSQLLKLFVTFTQAK